MSQKVSKNIQYLRASQDEALFDLETAIRRLLNLAPTVNDTQIEQFGFVYRIQYRNPNFVLQEATVSQQVLNEGIALHVAYCIKDEHMRTLNNDAPVVNDAGGSSAPPTGQSFMTKEAFLYVNKHHVLFAGNGLRYEAVCSYLNQLNNALFNTVEAGVISKIDVSFKPVANFDKLKLIKRYGAKKLHLNASAYQLSLETSQAKQTDDSDRGFLAQFKQLGSIFQKLSTAEPTDEEINAAQDINVCLALSLDGNTRASIEAQQFMSAQAELIAESDEIDSGFYIETQRGDKIRPTDVRLFKQIRIRKFEQTNSLSQTEVFDSIRLYFQELKHLNLTES
jgi:hypothetical protein